MSLTRVEDELVVHCARTKMDKRRLAAIEGLLEHDLDWRYVFRTLTRNRVTTLFYHSVSSIPEADLNPKARIVLKRRFHKITQRNLRLKAELLKILRLFGANSISCLPVKGPVLAETVYKDLSLREFGDIDILIGDADFSQAEDLLRTIGYEQDDKADEHVVKHLHHERFRHSETGTLVELHWELAERYRAIFQIKDLPPNAITTIDFDNTRVNSLTREFLLLYLCVHGYRHQWERLSWICDIAEIVNGDADLDWEFLYQQARELHLLKILHMGLYLASEILDCEIPEPIREKLLEDRLIVDLAERVQRRLFTGEVLPVDEEEKENREEYFLFNYALLTNPLHKARYSCLLLYSLFMSRFRWRANDRDRSCIRLNKGFSFIYPVIRPLRLVRQYGIRRIKLMHRVLSRQLQ